MVEMSETATAILAALAWTAVSTVLDARGAAIATKDLQQIIGKNPWWVFLLALSASIFVAIVAPEGHKVATTVLTSAFFVAAYADYVHKLFWEEISITTLIAVLGTQAFYGHGASAAMGAAVIGGGFCIIYFVAALLGRETGMGDLLPVTALGAAFGTIPALEGFGIGAIGLVLAAITLRGIGKEIPMGPGLAIAAISAVIFLRTMPNITT